MSEDLLTALQAADNPADKATIIAESCFDDLDETAALVARRCIALHWFDEPVIAALLPKNADVNAVQVLQILAALPFVEKLPWGVYSYHELTREGLLKHFQATQPVILTEATSLAASAYAAYDEPKLLELAARSDPNAIAALYRLYAPKVYNYIYHRTSDVIVAEDLTGQAFLKMIEALESGEGWRTSFSGWLYRTAHNLVIDFYRERG